MYSLDCALISLLDSPYGLHGPYGRLQTALLLYINAMIMSLPNDANEQHLDASSYWCILAQLMHGDTKRWLENKISECKKHICTFDSSIDGKRKNILVLV